MSLDRLNTKVFDKIENCLLYITFTNILEQKVISKGVGCKIFKTSVALKSISRDHIVT